MVVMVNGDKDVYNIEEIDDKFALNGLFLKKNSKTFTWKQKNENDVFWYRWETVT